jgi:hypothetical protein
MQHTITAGAHNHTGHLHPTLAVTSIGPSRHSCHSSTHPCQRHINHRESHCSTQHTLQHQSHSTSLGATHTDNVRSDDASKGRVTTTTRLSTKHGGKGPPPQTLAGTLTQRNRSASAIVQNNSMSAGQLSTKEAPLSQVSFAPHLMPQRLTRTRPATTLLWTNYTGHTVSAT